MSAVRLVIAGIAGRMGRAVLAAALAEPRVAVAGALEAPGHPLVGQALTALEAGAGAALVSADPLPLVAAADALIDFTTPASSVTLAGLAAQARIAHVIGTTGFSADDEAKLTAAARHATLIRSGNMSLGVNLLIGLVARAAAALPEFDVEILEMHHGAKLDAPSGTALMLGTAAAEGRGVPLSAVRAAPRDGHTGRRAPGGIGFAALRGGTVVGDHTVILAGPGERIEITHRAEDRAIFARGAIAAALWGAGRPRGLYTMQDVLGLGRAPAPPA